MDDMVSIIFLAINIGLCILAGAVLSFRVKDAEVYCPLAIFFFLFAFLNFTTVMNSVAPQYDILLSAISVTLVSLLLWPMFWFYIEGLTQETRWHFGRRHAKHLMPIVLGLLTAITIALLPNATRLRLFGDNAAPTDTSLATAAVILLSLVILTWCVQTILYFFLGLRRLVKYRRRLRDIFASTESRELTWLFVLFLCLGVTGLLAILGFFAPEPYGGFISAKWEELILMGFLFTLAVWGLRQTPGFEQIYEDQEKAFERRSAIETEASHLSLSPETTPSAKYQNSGLDEVRAIRIAGKLETLMQSEELYLDPNLSLPRLAKRVGVSTNILSQTLNETIKVSFFDYVNKYRIVASLPMIASRDKPILSVAMEVGFNSRSAFYKAFKREIGTTPGSYLANHHNNRNDAFQIQG